MRRKRHSPEQVVRKLREAEADLGAGTDHELGVRGLRGGEADTCRACGLLRSRTSGKS